MAAKDKCGEAGSVWCNGPVAKGADAGQPSEPGDGREEQVKALTSQGVKRDAVGQVLSRNKQL